MQIKYGTLKKILWAYDPFEDDISVDPVTISELEEITRKSGADIEPVYIYTPPADFVDLKDPDFNVLSNLIKRRLNKYLPVTKPRILINDSLSLSKGISKLLRYATESFADLIIVSSHGRHGIARMTFGSFAETLLNQSKVPLLFLNKEADPRRGSMQTVLFATDFSEQCKRAFNHFLRAMSGICNQIIIYHDMNFVYEMTIYGTMYGSGIPISDEVIEEQINWIDTEFREWILKARDYGFSAKALVKERNDVSRSILRAAEEQGAGLIVITSQSGPLSSLILGSRARSVFRDSKIPVWAYGPRQFEMITRDRRSMAAKDVRISPNNRNV